MQYRFGYHPMLPPLEPQRNPLHLHQQNALMGYNIHQMCIPTHQVNAPNNPRIHQGVETSHQQSTTTHTHQGNSKKQPPIKSFIHRESAIENAQNAIQRLYQDSTENEKIDETLLPVS